MCLRGLDKGCFLCLAGSDGTLVDDEHLVLYHPYLILQVLLGSLILNLPGLLLLCEKHSQCVLQACTLHVLYVVNNVVVVVSRLAVVSVLL